MLRLWPSMRERPDLLLELWWGEGRGEGISYVQSFLLVEERESVYVEGGMCAVYEDIE